MRIITHLIFLFAVTFFVSDAEALNRRVRIHNNTTQTAVALFADAGSHVVPDLLGDHMLPPGQAIIVDFGGDAGPCSYTLVLRLYDGSSRVMTQINVCSHSDVHFY